MLGQLSVLEEDTLSAQQLEAVAMVMSIASSRASKVSVLGSSLVAALPGPVKSVIEGWSSTANTEFPSVASWVRDRCLSFSVRGSLLHCLSGCLSICVSVTLCIGLLQQRSLGS